MSNKKWLLIDECLVIDKYKAIQIKILILRGISRVTLTILLIIKNVFTIRHCYFYKWTYIE